MRDGLIVAAAAPAELLARTRAAEPRGRLPRARGGSMSARGRSRPPSAFRQLRHDRRTLAPRPSCRRSWSRSSATSSTGSRKRSTGSAARSSASSPSPRCSSSPRSRCCASGRAARSERLMSMPIAKGDLLGGQARLRRRRGGAGVDHVRRRLRPARAGHGRAGVGGGADRGRERAARDGARSLPERLRDDGVPGRPVHARRRDPADPPLRPARPARAMAEPLEWLSNLLLLTCLRRARAGDGGGEIDADLWLDVGIVAGCVVLALALGAATLRRRTP